jgi:hypothetical protein
MLPYKQLGVSKLYAKTDKKCEFYGHLLGYRMTQYNYNDSKPKGKEAKHCIQASGSCIKTFILCLLM